MKDLYRGLEIIKKMPEGLLLPTLGLPLIGFGREYIDAFFHGPVVGCDEEEVLQCICLLDLLDGMGTSLEIKSGFRIKEWLGRTPATCILQLGQGFSVIAFWQTQLQRRTHLSRVVAEVTSQDHESVGVDRRANKPTHMANGMSRGIQEVEGSIIEEVKSLESIDLKMPLSLEIHLPYLTASFLG